MVHTEFLGKKSRTFQGPKSFFQGLLFAVILYRMTPSLYTCCFVCAFCLWCVISTCSVNRSHHLHKVFLLSALSELTRLCIESQVPTSYCTDTDPSALFTVLPSSFQFKTILKISILQFHVKFSRPFKCIGGGGFAYCYTFPQEGLVIRVIQILENELYREH